MTRLELLRMKRQEILDLAQKHGAGNLRVFGSVIRGQDDRESDIDVLVHLDRGRTYFDVIHLQQDLERALGSPVDLVLDTAIKPLLREEIHRSAAPL